eukprot:jgi/Ulvmu1/10021/UM059_0070.1
MEMLATLSDATAADPPAKAAIAVVVSQMADSSAVAWVPSFGAALVAIDQTIPQARTVIHAICLDAWEQNTHREEESGTWTASSLCSGHQPKLVTTTVPGTGNLATLAQTVQTRVLQLNKKSRTPGFFVHETIQVAGGAATHRYSDSKKASGGFRDVGNHTTAERLPTCWPLVEQVFHHFMQQVRLVNRFDAQRTLCFASAHHVWEHRCRLVGIQRGHDAWQCAATCLGTHPTYTICTIICTMHHRYTTVTVRAFDCMLHSAVHTKAVQRQLHSCMLETMTGLAGSAAQRYVCRCPGWTHTQQWLHSTQLLHIHTSSVWRGQMQQRRT